MLDLIAALRERQELPGTISGIKEKYPHQFLTSKRDHKLYWVIQLIYHQQKYMYDTNTHSDDNPIVNIYQAYVRPIPRGKDKQATELGVKISASKVDGIS